jgi:hypothetical protein
MAGELYLGSSCPDRSFSEELSAAEIISHVHKVLDHGANPNPRANPVPLQEGVVSIRVSLFEPISMAYTLLSFHHAHGLVQGLGGVCSELRSAKLPEDAARRVNLHITLCTRMRRIARGCGESTYL